MTRLAAVAGRRAIVLLAIAACMLAGAPRPCAASAPPWLHQAKAAADPAAKAAAVVLVDEEEVTVLENGRLRTVRRYAMRLQQRDGRAAAAIRHVYYPDAGKPRLRAWLLRADGGTVEYDEDRLVDAALAEQDVYAEVRVRAMSASGAIAPGDVFGAEVEIEERALFSQVEWWMQGRWPVRQVVRRLTLPAGWTATSVTFNHAAIEPQRQPSSSQGQTLVWQLANLPEMADEPDMPPRSAIVPRVAVSYAAPGGGGAAAGQFASWSDVSTWLAGLSDAPAAPSDPVTRKAREIAGAATGARERIAALARFVQGVPYASIQIGVGRGGGYRPRAAALVLARHYGDCKDKATLLRAMLGAIGVRSWMVSIYSGDPDYVRDSFPSPQQFNHAIVAIGLDETIGAGSELAHPTLGRLLFFDPTDESTPLGELPLAEQGSLALLVSGRDGSLVRMPLAAADTHKTRRTFAAALDSAGGLTVDIRETTHGARAADARALARAAGTARLREWVERRAAATFPGSQILELAPGGDGSGAEASTLRVRLRAERYAQTMPGQLLIVKPPFSFGGDTPAASGGAARTQPLVLASLIVEDTLELTLPDGYVVDETPAPVSLDGPFGRYAIACTRPDETRLVITRRLDVPRRTVPAAEHAGAKAFFEQVRAADAAPVVLAKKP